MSDYKVSDYDYALANLKSVGRLSPQDKAVCMEALLAARRVAKALELEKKEASHDT